MPIVFNWLQRYDKMFEKPKNSVIIVYKWAENGENRRI